MDDTVIQKNAVQQRYNKLGPKIAEALKKRNFDAYYFAEPEEALMKVFSLIPAEDTVSWGGSMTMDGLGLTDKLKEEGFSVIDRDSAKSPGERQALMRQALTCDTFIMGSNAVSEDGQLVNIDGAGNRVAAMCYGPKQVIVLAGMNKVVKTLEDAVSRARNTAAPLNTQRFPNLTTPCAMNGSCADCKSPDSICTYLVVTRLSKPAGRIKVILIGKDLGF